MADHYYKILYNLSNRPTSSPTPREEQSIEAAKKAKSQPTTMALKFVLNRKGGTRCVLKLDHPGLNSYKKDEHQNHIAFRVKSLQPHRYSVRPRQGVVAPGTSVSITIFLIEREKEMLLKNFYLRKTSEDNDSQSVTSTTASTSNDKKDQFLIQTFTVKQKHKASTAKGKKNKELVKKDSAKNTKKKASKEESEELSKIWNIANTIVGIPIQNKKIKVRHVVDKIIFASDTERAQKEQREAITPSSQEEISQLENMTVDEMMKEIQLLRTLNSKLAVERDALRKDQKIKVQRKAVKWIG